jgi:hypothetical protein
MTVHYLLAFALIFTICSSAQEPPQTNAEKEIRALEMVRLESPNKTDVWADNVANEALFHLEEGTVANKKDVLAHMRHEVMDDSSEMSDTMFSQIGDVAIFSYVFRRTHHDDPSAVIRQHVRRTLVYKRTGSGWQLIASAVTIIPFADLEPKPVDPKILDSYLGAWIATPAASTLTLTREGGKLIAQESNDTEKIELLPVSDSTFVIRGDPDLITFEKDPNGNVSRMLFRDVGGSVRVYDRSITGRKHR